MSGDGAGLLAVPILLCVAAPIVVAGLAIGATALAVTGAVKLGTKIHESHQQSKLRAEQELISSGVSGDIVTLYGNLVRTNETIAETYNKQTLRITNNINEIRTKWNENIKTANIKIQNQFHREIQDMRANLSETEARHIRALQSETDALLDAQDREFHQAVRTANNRIENAIHAAFSSANQNAEVSRELAIQYQKNAEELLKVLKEQYHGERFCSHEIESIDTLLKQATAKLTADTPAAAYALFWQAVESELLAINNAENAYQQWLMQYRIALQLAEEVKATIENESLLGYLVGEEYADTMENACRLCHQKHIPECDIKPLNADDYVYGDLAELKKEFQEKYARLHENEGVTYSMKDLYELIDDLHVKYAARLRKLLYEAKMNLNEALLIDRLEKQISEALHGSYHYSGSARSGNQHNGSKHILFCRDGDPDDQLCVVLKNDGWDDNDCLVSVDVHVVKDHKVNETKRRRIRDRISSYVCAKNAGSRGNIGCVNGTINNLTTKNPAQANLAHVRDREVRRT